MNRDHVILVTPNDEAIGTCEKLKAHKEGLLHRAFSVFIFNKEGKLYLQQRAFHKYHSPGLWTNTCCSHPQQDEDVKSSAIRRLYEEMGMNVDELYLIDKFTYYVRFDNGLIEHELDYVFIGFSDEVPSINKNEVQNWKTTSLEELKKDIQQNPDVYTYWFKLLIPLIEKIKFTDYVG